MHCRRFRSDAGGDFVDKVPGFFERQWLVFYNDAA